MFKYDDDEWECDIEPVDEGTEEFHNCDDDCWEGDDD